MYFSHPSSLTQRILSLLSDDQLAEVMKRSYYQYIVPVKKKVSSCRRSLLTISVYSTLHIERRLSSVRVQLRAAFLKLIVVELSVHLLGVNTL